MGLFSSDNDSDSDSNNHYEIQVRYDRLDVGSLNKYWRLIDYDAEVVLYKKNDGLSTVLLGDTDLPQSVEEYTDPSGNNIRYHQLDAGSLNKYWRLIDYDAGVVLYKKNDGLSSVLLGDTDLPQSVEEYDEERE